MLELNDFYRRHLRLYIYNRGALLYQKTAAYFDGSSPCSAPVLQELPVQAAEKLELPDTDSSFRAMRHCPCTFQLLETQQSICTTPHDSCTPSQPNKNCGLIGSVGPVVLYWSTVSPHQYRPSEDSCPSFQTCSRRSPTS